MLGARKSFRIGSAPFWVAAALWLSGCSQMGADPGKVTPFLEHADQLQAQPERSPFQQNWSQSPDKLAPLAKTGAPVVIKPVNLTYLGQASDPTWSSDLTLDASPEAAQTIADYMRKEFVKAINSKKDLGWQAVDQAGPGTIVLELALVELKPTQVYVNAAESIGGLFLPGSQIVSTAASAGLSTATSSITKGSIAMEMRVTDGSTGELLAEAGDRREDRSALLVNINDYSKFGYSKQTIDAWAKETAELLSTPPDH